MPDGRRRSREHWSDSMEAGPANPPAHTHRLPPVVRIAAVGLTGAVALVIVALVLIGLAVYQADQYVKGRGEYRDQETERTNQRINDAMCDLLDQLPEGGLLDRPRRQYRCGPGIPLEQLTPAEQAQLNGAKSPPPLPLLPEGVEVAPDGFQYGASANAPRQPYYPSPGVAEPPPAVPYPPGFPPPDPVQPTAPPPLVDLAPITEPLCDALGVCA